MRPALRAAVLTLVVVGVLAAGPAGPARAAGPITAGDGTGSIQVRATLVWHGPRDRRVVALTFDDGYAPWNVRRILRILDDEGVVATFFVNGVYARRDPALWRAAGRAGHAFGNHTYDHADATRMTATALAADLRRNERVVEAATGRPMAPIFRPPYGRRTAATDAAAAAAGFATIVMWDTSAGDTARPARARASVRRATAGRPGSIVLFHAGPRLTPRILRAVIRSYRDRGFAFITVPDLLGLPAVVSSGGPARPTAARAGDFCAAAVAGPRPECALEDEEGAPAQPAVGDADGGASAGGAPGHVALPAPRRTPVPDLPPARASAWARGPGAETAVAVSTVGLLGLLLAGGAFMGRRRRPAREARPPST